MIIQLTGLSGAGKTTIANAVKKKLEPVKISVEVIDGDLYRKTLCKDLGFSKGDRIENIRRLGAIAFEFSQKNQVVILAAINPYIQARNELKEKFKAITVYVECSLPTLIKRDTKGLYKRALLPVNHPDKIQGLSGITDPYDVPLNAELILKTDDETIDESVEKLYQYIIKHLE